VAPRTRKTRQKGGPTERVQITPAFRALVRGLVAKFGSVNAAAVRFRELHESRHPLPSSLDLAVSQPTLWRLCARKPIGAIQWPTYAALISHAIHFDVGTPRAWRTSVFSPDALRAFDRYYARLDRELRRIDPERRVTALERRLENWGTGPRSAWREVQRFRRWLARHHPTRGATRVRYRYALARAFEPLLLAESFGGMEVTADDLHKSGKLDAYVRAALARERILLSRATDEQRAQEVHPMDGDGHRRDAVRVAPSRSRKR
jgi:hypothetical protein